MSLHLGIDIGTSGVRTAVIDETKTVISSARADHLPQRSDCIDANYWWDAVSTCLMHQTDSLKRIQRNPAEIRHVAVDGTSGSMVLTDANLKPVSRALMYNSSGFNAEAETLRRFAPSDHITQGVNSALARAMRLVSETSDARHLLHQADFIAAKLLGRGGYSDHNNALKTGFNPENEAWPDWIGHVIPPAVLPAVKPAGGVIDRVNPEIAKRFGWSNQAIVHAGTTDSIAAFLAAAPIQPKVAVTSLGSTLAVKILCHNRIDNHAIGLYSHRLGDVWLAGGASNTGGAVLATFFSADQIDALSKKMDVTRATGLDYYPLLKAGERFPVNNPELQPKLTPRPNDDAVFLQAMFEGIARIEAECYRAVEMCGGDYPETLYTAGGGAANPQFTQIRSRTLGLSPRISRDTEAAIGVAKLTFS